MLTVHPMQRSGYRGGSAHPWMSNTCIGVNPGGLVGREPPDFGLEGRGGRTAGRRGS